MFLVWFFLLWFEGFFVFLFNSEEEELFVFDDGKFIF